MSANDWHSHAAQVRPLHPVPAPRVRTIETHAPGALLTADLTALTRVLLGPTTSRAAGSADPAPAAVESPGALLAPVAPVAVELPDPSSFAVTLPPLPDVDLPPFEPAVPFAPAAAEPVAVPSVASFEEQAFRPQPIVEVEPLVVGSPVESGAKDPEPVREQPEDLGSLVVLEQDPFAPPAPPQQHAVVLDDLAFLDI